eukprot:jgi/Tetstr1/447290/TSEL_034727.t1
MAASTALTCAFLCAYAYDKDRLTPSAFRPRCERASRWPAVHRALTDWQRFGCDDSDVQVVFAYRERDRTVFVAFRGTDSWRDALVNAAVIKKALPFMQDTDPGARVHAGFFSQYRAAVDAVKRYRCAHPDRSRTVVTGHSLGGGVATLCAAMVKDEAAEERCRCYVFGCPRVGNSAFVARVDEVLDLRRFVVGYDPVASVPTRARWQHAGRRVWFVNGKRVRADDGDPWTNVVNLPNLLCLRDHDIARYIDCVADDSDGDNPDDASDASPRDLKPWWRASVEAVYATLVETAAYFFTVVPKTNATPRGS